MKSEWSNLKKDRLKSKVKQDVIDLKKMNKKTQQQKSINYIIDTWNKDDTKIRKNKITCLVLSI